MVITSRPLPKESKRSKSNLASIEEVMSGAIFRPLDGESMQSIWVDGRCMEEVAAEIIKPNRFLTSFERLELYNRQYWFRLLDCFYEDFPGLMAVMGDEKCEALATAYLTRYPSRSFTLRDLGSRLEKFVLEEPQWTAPNNKLCLDIIRFEWAEVVAFDGPAKPTLKQESLQGADADRLKLELQPYVTLLELDYALDDFLLKLNNQSDKSVESNAVIEIKRKPKKRSMPKALHNFVAVHRVDNIVYYKRLNRGQYLVLNALREGKPLGQACAEAYQIQEGSKSKRLTSNLSRDFSTWMELGWFCEAL